MGAGTPLQSGFMAVHGNRLEDLRDLTVEWLKGYPLAPLENEVILVQSNGIAQWLKLALAADVAEEGGGCGIAAALDVQLPGRFLWQAYRSVLGEEQVAAQSPFDKTLLSWRLMRLLPQLMTQAAFEPLQRFLHDDQDLRKRYQLAERLADLLDQYQVYRADWLEDWGAGLDQLRDARGELKPLDTSQRWQPALWRMVLDDIRAQAGGDSRAVIHERFLKQAKALKHRPVGLPRRIVVFGISSLPRQALQVLAECARFSQVLLCVHNPCMHHWADIVEHRELLRQRRSRQARKPGMPALLAEEELHQHAHPLLAAWGKQGRDYIGLLDEFDQPESYRAAFDRIDLFQSSGEDRLLNQLQDDICELRPLQESRDKWRPVDPRRDASIRFHLAHSPQREVEILHDQLLHCFSADASLRPRDVIVMVPNIDAYAPHIRAVFGQFEGEDRRHIPFTLSDQSQRRQDPLLIALECLLSLPQQRFSVSELLDLLDVPAVRKRFGVKEEDLPTLRRWIEGAGVRWGLHAEQRQSLELPQGLEQNSWYFGLRRMLLGYAVGSGDEWQGIEPFDEVGGLEAALVGPLCALIDALESFWQELRKEKSDRSPQGWAERLDRMLERFFRPAGKRDALTLTQLKETLEHWERACADAGLCESLPLTVVRESLLASLDSGGLAQRFLAGAVNFCTLMPMRAIPFRIVCLLGMNDGDYPRAQSPLDFDLMARDYRPGDRSRREDDRYLLLEALLSARERLHVSWVGRSIRDNSERPPSVLIGQLRDHLAAGWRLVGEPAEEEDAGKKLVQALTLEHPLQPFSRAYFQGAPQLFTYSREWRAMHPARREKPRPQNELQKKKPEPQQEKLAALKLEAPLTLATLAAFLRNPVEAFFNQRLKVYFDEASDSSKDLEPFKLNGLDDWQLKDRLMRAGLQAPNEQAAQTLVNAAAHRLERAGLLPLGSFAELQRQELAHPIIKLLSAHRRLLDAYPNLLTEPSPLRYNARELVLEDWLGGLCSGAAGEGLVHLQPSTLYKDGKPKFRHLLRPWLAHLASHACGLRLTSYIVGPDKVVTLPPLAKEAACDWLEQLIEAWQQGMCEPLPIACEAAFAWLDRVDKGEDAARRAARSAYEGDGHRSHGELGYSTYLRRAWPDADALFKDGQFGRWVEQLYRPLFETVTPRSASSKKNPKKEEPV